MLCLEVTLGIKEGISERAKLGQFEIFGLDIIVDADQRAYLLEANRDPSWVIDTEVKKKILPDMVREMRLGWKQFLRKFFKQFLLFGLSQTSFGDS